MSLNHSYKSSSLGNLPLELLPAITKYLPRSSAITLSFVCRDFYYNEDLKRIRARGLSKIDPINLTANDLRLSFPLWNFYLHTEDFSRVMNGYLPLDSLRLNTDWVLEKGSSNKTWMAKADIEPKIFSNMLMIHTRQRILFTTQQLDFMNSLTEGYSHYIAWHTVKANFRICEASCEWDPLRLRWLEIEAMGLLCYPNYSRHVGIHSCPDCRTQFTLSSISHRGGKAARGFELVLHTWKNLGTVGQLCGEGDEPRLVSHYLPNWVRKHCPSAVYHASFEAALNRPQDHERATQQNTDVAKNEQRQSGFFDGMRNWVLRNMLVLSRKCTTVLERYAAEN